MLFILSLIGTVSFVLLFRKAIKKYAVPFYLVATAITVFFLVYRLSGNIQIPDVINKYVMKPLSQGTISTALFSIVMWIGALNRKNPVVKKLFSIRGEMSYKGIVGIKDTAMEVRKARKRGIMVLGVFTGKEIDLEAEKKIYGKDFIYIKDIQRFSDIVSTYLKKVIIN